MRSNKFKLILWDDTYGTVSAIKLVLYQNAEPRGIKLFISIDSNGQPFISGGSELSGYDAIPSLLKKKKDGKLGQCIAGSVRFDPLMLTLHNDRAKRSGPRWSFSSSPATPTSSAFIPYNSKELVTEDKADLGRYMYIRYILEKGHFYGNFKKRLNKLYGGKE